MKSFLWPMWLLAALLFFESPAAFAQRLTPAPPTSAPGEPSSIAVRTQLVSLTVAVLDKRGRHFTGLDKASFTVFEDGIAQEISFFGIDDGPATVAVVFDLSGSMGGAKIRRAAGRTARPAHEPGRRGRACTSASRATMRHRGTASPAASTQDTRP